MKAEELRQKDKSALHKTLDELSKEQFKLKMQIGSGQLTKNHLLGQVRRDIARVKTVLTQKEKGE